MYYKLVLDGRVDFLDEPADYSENIAVIMAPTLSMAIAIFRIMSNKYGVFKTSIPIEPENIQEATFEEFQAYVDKLM